MNNINFQNHLDMQGNSILNVGLQVLPSAPNNAFLGQVYYDSTLKSFMGFDGQNWRDLAQVATDYTQAIETAKEQATKDSKDYTDTQLQNVNVDYKTGFEQVLGLNDTNINNKLKEVTGLTQEEKQLIANLANKYADDTVNRLKEEIYGGVPAENLDSILELANQVKEFDDLAEVLKTMPKGFLQVGVGNGVDTSNTIQHNLNSKYVDVLIFDSNGNRTWTSYTCNDENTVVIHTGVSALNNHIVKVLG